jgi:hypothetical protein
MTKLRVYCVAQALVQKRSAGSVAWRRLCLYGAGNHGRSRGRGHCFGLKRLYRPHVRADVVRDGFKFAQDLLHFIHNAFIL